MGTKMLLKENEMKMRAEMEARLEALEVKLEEKEAKLALLESSHLLDAPQVVMCAYQDLWMQEDSPISFDEFLTNFHNAEGDGALDLTTGTFTAMNPGFYSITFGGDVGTGPGLSPTSTSTRTTKKSARAGSTGRIGGILAET